MQIKKRLYLSTLISMILAVTFFYVIFTLSGMVAKQNKIHERAQKLHLIISKLDLITYEYLLHYEERMIQQWNSIYNSAAVILRNSDKAETMVLRSHFNNLGELFLRINRNHYKYQSLASIGLPEWRLNQVKVVKDRLVSQILLISELIISNASNLSEESFQEITRIEKLHNNLVVALFMAITITVLTAFILTIRSIATPLGNLTAGVNIISSGDLTQQIKPVSKDEIGWLAEKFDVMRLNLKASYSDLEKKIQAKTKDLAVALKTTKQQNIMLNETKDAALNLVEDLGHAKSNLEIEVEERKNAEIALEQYKDQLEVLVQERTIDLEMSNKYLTEAVKELETFSYSIAHDLNAPLRAISGFSGMLREDYAGNLDEEGNRLLGVINDNAVQMGQLIENILHYSRMVRKPLEKGEVHIKKLTEGVILELEEEYKGRDIEFNVQEVPNCKGDSMMIKQVLGNLLSNAIKFTRNKGKAVIKVGSMLVDDETVY